MLWHEVQLVDAAEYRGIACQSYLGLLLFIASAVFLAWLALSPPGTLQSSLSGQQVNLSPLSDIHTRRKTSIQTEPF